MGDVCVNGCMGLLLNRSSCQLEKKDGLEEGNEAKSEGENTNSEREDFSEKYGNQKNKNGKNYNLKT